MGLTCNAPADTSPTWTPATASASWPTRGGHSSVVFNGKMWVIGGVGIEPGGFLSPPSVSMRTDAWSSSDGAAWSPETTTPAWSPRAGHTSVVFNNELWVLGGGDFSNIVSTGNLPPGLNDVWHSADGVTWTQATANAQWSPRYFHTSVVFNNEMWVIGGQNNSTGFNDVWSSSDGVTWTPVTTGALWQARGGHTSVVFGNQIWVIGGGYEDPTGTKSVEMNDVWSSSDGITWTQQPTDPAKIWSARAGHTSLVFDNKMWVMGGQGESGGLNEVWSSPDGASWTQAAIPPWPARSIHASVVFENKMWIIGGLQMGSKPTSIGDVWSMAGTGGSVTVTIQPPEAVAAGAQWSIDNGATWHNSGEEIDNLQPGSATVKFSDVAGWAKPDDQNLTISEGQATTSTGTYVKQAAGSVSVTIQPAAAVAAGAQWSVDGGGHWNNSGATVNGVPTGQATILFKEVAGWTAPANQTITVLLNQTATATGTYTLKTGNVSVAIQPADAVTAGAQWSIDNGAHWNDSGATVRGIPIGNATVTFKDLTVWKTPASQSVTIVDGQTATVTATYILLTGSLTITIKPAEAVAAGAKWSVDGGAAWQDSGATVTGVMIGTATVTFKDIPGWTKPANRSLTITTGGSASDTGTYTPPQYTITTSVTGQGTVALNPTGGTYTAGTAVAVTATAASGWQFDHWEGGLTGNANPASITMDADKNVTAVFTQTPVGCFGGMLDKTARPSPPALPPLDYRQMGDWALLAATLGFLRAARGSSRGRKQHALRIG